jgi:hypothetical protein
MLDINMGAQQRDRQPNSRSLANDFVTKSGKSASSPLESYRQDQTDGFQFVEDPDFQMSDDGDLRPFCRLDE